jgi:serine phosphatase RsbU (regulator of sigma subunit)
LFLEAILRGHHGQTMARLSAILLEAVQAFAQGAPQEDDMTAVVVRRIASP